MKRFLFLATILACAVAGYYFIQKSQGVIRVENAYITGDIVTVTSPFEGRFNGFSKHNGDNVSKFETLGSKDISALELDLNIAKMELFDTIQAEIDACLDLKTLSSDIEITSMEQGYAEKTEKRVTKLQQTKAVTEDVIEQAQHSHQYQRLKLAKLKNQLTRQSTELHIPIMHRWIVQKKLSEYKKHLYALDQATIASPVKGVIYKVIAHPGDYVKEGDPLLSIIPGKSQLVEAFVLEIDLNRIDMERQVLVEPMMSKGQQLSGRIKQVMPSVASVFSPLPRNNVDSNWIKVTQRVPVLIQLDQVSQTRELPIGGSVTVTFATKGLPEAEQTMVKVSDSEPSGEPLVRKIGYQQQSIKADVLLQEVNDFFAGVAMADCKLNS